MRLQAHQVDDPGGAASASASRDSIKDLILEKINQLWPPVFLPSSVPTCLATWDRIVAGKQAQPQWLGVDDAIRHREAGIGIWDWALNDRDMEEPENLRLSRRRLAHSPADL
jgi:XFP C-terminal domain